MASQDYCRREARFGRLLGSLAIGLIGVSLNACGTDVAPRAGALKVDTLPGGTIRVDNPMVGLWDAAPGSRWQVVEVLRIGRLQGSGPDVFGRVGSVLADDLGRIWIVDQLANEIRVFGSDGQFIRTIGRKGAGPGEFRRIGRAFPGPSGEVWVEDISLSRWEVFDTAGTRIAGYRFGSSMPGGMQRFTRDGRFLVLDGRSGLPDAGPALVAYRLGSDRELLPVDTFTLPTLTAIPPQVTYSSRDGRARISQPVPFTARPWITLDGDGDLWAADGDGTYAIRRQSLEGDTILIIHRAYRPVAIPDSARERAVEELLDWFSTGVPGGIAREELNLARIPEVYPPFDRGYVSADGALWVRRTLGGNDFGFDVFSKEGEYLGLADTPDGLGRMRIEMITADAVYAVDTDSLGVNTVLRLEIRQPEHLGVTQ